MCFSKIRRIFGKRKPKKEVVVKEKPPRKWWQVPVRVVRTSRGGLNMPKFQPCPQCHAGSKRYNKTMGGANYSCRTHGEFFVRI